MPTKYEYIIYKYTTRITYHLKIGYTFAIIISTNDCLFLIFAGLWIFLYFKNLEGGKHTRILWAEYRSVWRWYFQKNLVSSMRFWSRLKSRNSFQSYSIPYIIYVNFQLSTLIAVVRRKCTLKHTGIVSDKYNSQFRYTVERDFECIGRISMMHRNA